MTIGGTCCFQVNHSGIIRGHLISKKRKLGDIGQVISTTLCLLVPVADHLTVNIGQVFYFYSDGGNGGTMHLQLCQTENKLS